MTTETQKSVREHCAPQGRRVRGQADQQTHHSTLASKTLYRIKLLPEIYTFYHLRRPPCSFMLLLSTGQQLSDGPFHQNFLKRREKRNDDCSVTGHRSQLVACQRTERERDGGESHLWSMNVSRFQVIDRGFAPTCSYVGSLAKRGGPRPTRVYSVSHQCAFRPVRLSSFIISSSRQRRQTAADHHSSHFAFNSSSNNFFPFHK